MPVFPNICPNINFFTLFVGQLKVPSTSPFLLWPGKAIAFGGVFLYIYIGEENKKWGSGNEAKL